MSSWIKERADLIRNAERERKEEFERKAVAATDLKAKLNPFWRELVEVLDQSVRDFNSEFIEASRRLDPFERVDSSTVVIRRTAYPAVSVKLQLSNAGTTVQYMTSRTAKKGMNTVEKQGSFSYSVTEGAVGYSELSLRSHEEVAKLLLDPFFEF